MREARPKPGLPKRGSPTSAVSHATGQGGQQAGTYLGLSGTKETKETNKGPDVPVASPQIYAGIIGEIAHAAEPTTEADPVGITPRCCRAPACSPARARTCGSATCTTRC